MSANLPITDAFDNLVNSMQQVYDWNGAWLYRNELTETGGLAKVGARWYDPAVGRFLQQNLWKGEIYEPLTLNRYLYCTNDPLNWLDYTGLIKVKVTISTEASVKGEIVSGLLLGGKLEITLKGSVSMEIELEGKDIAEIRRKASQECAKLAADLKAELSKVITGLRIMFKILDSMLLR